MIRFSERHAGQFAISYVQGGLVKHYLVQATDTAGARKTLGDFVLEQAQYVIFAITCRRHKKRRRRRPNLSPVNTRFTHILQVLFDHEGRVRFSRYPKYQCFAPFAASRIEERRGDDDGYDPLDS
jgi:hypothetical protein